MDKQSILDKYESSTLDSLKLNENLLDIEKNIIFEKESQIPNLVINSNCPFNKNYCFYDIALNVSTKENIFPKKKYYLKSQQIIEIKPLDINSIFNEDKAINNNTISSSVNEGKLIKDDENLVHNKIMSSIKSNNYKSYIPKKIKNEKNEATANNNINLPDNLNSNSEWYIIGNNTNNEPDGPYNDLQMYNKLYQIYYTCLSKKEKSPNYLINEKKSNIFMTMDDCFDRLKKRYQYLNTNQAYANNNQLANKANMNLMNNYLLYQRQIMQYYQMNNSLLSNPIFNNYSNNNNKNTVPNKFDNSYNYQKQNKTIINNQYKNIKIDNNGNNNNPVHHFKNNNNFNNKNNNNYYKKKYNNRKEKYSKQNQFKDNNDYIPQTKNQNEINKEGNHDLKEVGIVDNYNSISKITSVDIESFFENK
jgi:hypothetical protein